MSALKMAPRNEATTPRKSTASTPTMTNTGAATPEEHMACERVFKVFYGAVVRTEEIATLWGATVAGSRPMAAAAASD